MIDAISEALGGVSTTVVYVLLGVAVLQVALQAWALVDLARAERVVGGKKWLWAVAIVFLSTGLGAVLYLAIGRRVPEKVSEPDLPTAGSAGRTARAVDTLYGTGGDGESR